MTVIVEGSVTLDLGPEAYEHFRRALGKLGGARVVLERRIWRIGPRCLWGWRPGYIQVGELGDKPDTLQIALNDVKVSAVGA